MTEPKAFAPLFLEMVRRGAYAPRYTMLTDERRPGLGEVVVRRQGLDVQAWRLRPHATPDTIPDLQPGYVYGEPIAVELRPVIIGGDQ